MRHRIALAVATATCAALWSTLPASAGATPWRATAPPAPGRGSTLLGVSCVPDGFCTAVGTSSGNTQVLVEQRAGGHWAIQSVPSPGGPQAVLTGVSCLSAADCTAVGFFGDFFGDETPVADHWDGSTWTIQPVPAPAGVQGAQLAAVTCVSATNCMAVGTFLRRTKGGPFNTPLADHWDGSTWTLLHVPVPPHPGQVFDQLSLSGVACPTATDCTAVGTSDTGFPGPLTFLAERWNGKAWSLEPTPALPAGTFQGSLNGVSCSSATHCTGVGSYVPGGGSVSVPVAMRSSGRTWALQQLPAPASDIVTLTGVSCVSGTSCTAVGQDNPPVNGVAAAVAYVWNGTGWTAQAVAPPPHRADAYGLNAISCTAAVHCTAVGTYRRSPLPLAERE